MQVQRFSTGMALLVTSAALALPAFAQQPPKKAPKPTAPRPATKPAAKPTTAPVAVSADVPSTAPKSQAWALLIGISKYQNPQIASLRYPATDATGIHDALVDKELGALPESNVRLLTNEQATASNIMSAVDSFLKPNVKPGDKVLIFLAGHGVAKGVGLDAKSYLLPGDVKGLTSAALEQSAVNLRTLSDKLSQLPASQFVVLVDACREDPTPGRGVKGNLLSDVLSRGVQIVSSDSTKPATAASFFACSVGQRAFEDPALNHGVFTYAILDGVRTAAAARKPDGAIDMGVLAAYVKAKVASWAKETSAKGDFEVEQTPEFVTSEVTDPIILMRVKKALPATSPAASLPQITVLSNPPGAQVSLDGDRIGAAPLTYRVARTGQHTLRVEAAGYAPLERAVTMLEGYDLLLTLSPPPDARGTTASGGSTAEMFRRAQDAEMRQQWEAAEAGYTSVLAADSQFLPAYERLANLRHGQGKLRPALDTLTQMVTKTPPTAHSLSLLAASYAELALQEAPRRAADAGDKPKKKGGLLGNILNKNDKKDGDKDADLTGGPAAYVVPKDWKDAAILARRAGEEAVKLEPNSAEANRALGFGLLATDRGGKNRDQALAAFGKAVLLDPKDAANQYGMGYGIRFFATFQKDDAGRNAELERAVNNLKEAINLRPDYYEAHRELAYCYHLLEKDPEAQKEYEAANANRGSAASADEVAALNLSLSSLYREMADSATGDRKVALLSAADGYFGDARDITPNLAVAVRYLANAQLSGRIARFMPSELQNYLDISDELRKKLKIPGGIPLPKFP